MNDLSELDDTSLPIKMFEAASHNGYASGTAIQQVRSSYATAVSCQIPRQLQIVARRIEDEARLAGEEFFYGWGVAKDRIEGPSIKLANALARCWGNCAIELLPIQELADSWIFTAVFVDLETGFTLPRQFRQSKAWKVYGKHDDERKADIRFQIGQSKAIRNVILNALPASLVDRAMKAAKSGVRSKLEAFIEKKSLAAAQDLIIGELAKVGVKEEAILRRCKVAARSALNVEMLIVLRGDISAIADGQERPEDLFPMETTAPQTVAALGQAMGAVNGHTNGKPTVTAPPQQPPPQVPPPPQPPGPAPFSPEAQQEFSTPAPKKATAKTLKALRNTIASMQLEDAHVFCAITHLGIDVPMDDTLDLALSSMTEADAVKLIQEIETPTQ